jgi:hypothetical protein
MSMDALKVLNEARRAVPAVNFALGVAGIAAAGALVSAFIGRGPTAIVLVALVFIGMVLLFIFSKLATSDSPSTKYAGVVLLWAVLLFFVTFLILTTTVFLGYGPAAWAQVLRVEAKDPRAERLARANYLLSRTVSATIPNQQLQGKVFSTPVRNYRRIDGCIKSSLFPEQFAEQCEREAQKIIATIYCRSMNYRESASHRAEMHPTVYPAYVLSFNEAPNDGIDFQWNPSETSGFVFEEIECK